MAGSAKPLILCVDDEPQVLGLIAKCVTDGGYEALTADSGEKALLALTSVKPDLILLDVMMPGMDGYALCAGLQADDRTAQIPVIFVTGLGGEQDKARAL